MPDVSDSPPDPGVSFSLRTFGTVALVRSDGVTVLGTHGSHRRRLALLAILAAAGHAGRSRDHLLLLFWPEAGQARAQHSLDQLLYALRSSISDAMFEGTNPLRLNPSVVASDVGAFDAALAQGDPERAVGVYRGAFLDGCYPNDAPEFERWADGERARLAEAFTGALATLARRATAAGDHAVALQWWTRLSEADPLSTKYAVGRIAAVAAAGDRAAALQYAKRYEAFVAQELGLPIDPDVRAAIEDVRDPTRDARRASNLHVPPVLTNSLTADAPASASPPWRTLHAGAIAALVLAIGIAAFAVWPRASAHGATRSRTANIAAHELYVRGDDPTLMRSDSGARAAVEDFQQAIALDSNYALAYAGLARALLRTSDRGSLTVRERRERVTSAERAAVRAVRLDDSLADAHAALSFVRRKRYDLGEAMQEMARAAALEPRDARFHEWLVQLYVIGGQSSEALVEARRAVALDPLSPTANAELARALFSANRCGDALTQLAKLESLQPPLLRAGSIAAQCYAKNRMWPEAIAQSRRVLASQRRGNGLLGFLLAQAGDVTAAMRLLDTLRGDARAGRADAFDIAAVYAGLGRRDSAFVWLDRSLDDGSLNFEYWNTILGALSPDPHIDSVRRHLGMQIR